MEEVERSKHRNIEMCTDHKRSPLQRATSPKPLSSSSNIPRAIELSSADRSREDFDVSDLSNGMACGEFASRAKKYTLSITPISVRIKVVQLHHGERSNGKLRAE